MGGLASRNSQRIWLVLIFSLACTLVDSALCDCEGNCDGWHHLSRNEQQHIWNAEAFYFIYGDCFYENYFSPGYYFGYPYYHVPADYGPAYYRSTHRSAASDASSGSNGTSGGGSADYWLKRADEMYLTGSYELAALSYARAVQLNPFLLDGWINMGNALYFLGMYEASLNSYDAALKLEPQNTNALQGKSQALSALNRAGPNARGTAGTSGSSKITAIGSVGSTAESAVEPVVVGSHPQI